MENSILILSLWFGSNWIGLASNWLNESYSQKKDKSWKCGFESYSKQIKFKVIGAAEVNRENYIC